MSHSYSRITGIFYVSVLFRACCHTYLFASLKFKCGNFGLARLNVSINLQDDSTSFEPSLLRPHLYVCLFSQENDNHPFPYDFFGLIFSTASGM